MQSLHSVAYLWGVTGEDGYLYKGSFMWWIIIIVVIIIIAFLFLSALFELGFRNQGNMDWLFYTQWCNEYFNNRNFNMEGYIHESSSHPSTLFEHDGRLVKVQLNAPLLIPPSLFSIDIIIDGKKMWHIPVFINKEEAYKVFDDYFVRGIKNKMNISSITYICHRNRY